MSPFIVTTKRPEPTYPKGEERAVNVMHAVSRRAVATLEDRRGSAGQLEDGARTIVYAQVIDAYGGTDRDDADAAETEHLWQAANLPESGGTVGPLPDGTVIEVEPETWHEVACEATTLDYATAVHLAALAERGDEQAAHELITAYGAAEEARS